MKLNELTFVDLFCGAGGLALGFRDAGFTCKLAIDSNSWAVETYRRNLGDHGVLAEIAETIELPSATVIVGGPPCQGFSSAGLRKCDDARNTLVGRFARIVARHRPRAFVFENVEGFLTAEHGARVRELLEPLVDVGYRIHLRKVNVANYGVAQHRKRVIVIGGLGWEPSFPLPTHAAYGAPGAHRTATGLPLAPNVADALLGLPPAREDGDTFPPDHVYRPVTGEDLKRITALKPGQTMQDLPKKLWHATFQRRAYRRVMDGTPTEKRGGPPAGLRRLHPLEPSKAITSGARTEFVHPFEDRPLTLRECARIQTFPDDFVFAGPLAAKALLIGNAVPPRFALAIARTMAADLARESGVALDRGQLLSFIPTVGDGMSPALARTQRLVLEHFDLAADPPRLPLWR